MTALLGQARLQSLARAAGVRQVTAGPEGLALTLRPGHGTRALAKLGSARPGMSVRDDRLVFARGSLPGADPLAQREAILAAMA